MISAVSSGLPVSGCKKITASWYLTHIIAVPSLDFVVKGKENSYLCSSQPSEQLSNQKKILRRHTCLPCLYLGFRGRSNAEE